MLFLQILALHLFLLFFPGRSWSSWNEPHDDSHVWYLSLQTSGERFEEHILTVNLLLQKLDNWMEEQLGTFDNMLSDHIKNLWEWLEEHNVDLNVWLSMYFWVLQEFHDRYLKESDYLLGREILFHDNCWGEYLDKEDTWQEDQNITLYKWLEEPPLIFYRALEGQDNDEGSCLQKYIEIQTQHLEDHVKILEELLDNYTATANKWLEVHGAIKDATFQKSAQSFLHAAPMVEKPGNTRARVFQKKELSVMKWLGKHINTLEEWLWGTVNQQQN